MGFQQYDSEDSARLTLCLAKLAFQLKIALFLNSEFAYN